MKHRHIPSPRSDVSLSLVSAPEARQSELSTSEQLPDATLSRSARDPSQSRRIARVGPTDELLTVDEVADLLRMKPKGIYSLVAGRRIPFIRVSNRVRFLRSDVVAWLYENRVPSLGEQE